MITYAQVWTKFLANESSVDQEAGRKLLCHVANASPAKLLTSWQELMPADQEAAFNQLWTAYQAGTPLAYLLKQQWFYGHCFYVNQATLIPRPETERLVDAALTFMKRLWPAQHQPLIVVDVGTGTGIIALTLARFWTQAYVYGTDISHQALKVAQLNQQQLKLKRVKFKDDDLISHFLPKTINVLVANLPYIANDESLPKAVVDYEPKVALYGGHTGIELYQRLFQQAKQRLATRNLIVIEFGANQKSLIDQLRRTYFPTHGYTYWKDWNNQWRNLILWSQHRIHQ